LGSPPFKVRSRGDPLSLWILAAQSITLSLESQHRSKLIRANLIEANPDAQLQRTLKFNRAPQHQPSFGRLRGIESVQRAVVTSPSVVWRIVAKSRIAEFIPAQ
jgi:hypothetical protein